MTIKYNTVTTSRIYLDMGNDVTPVSL